MVERFSNSRNPNGLGFSNGIETDENGSYVRFEDYATLSARAASLQTLLDKAVEVLEPFAGVAELVDIDTEGFSDADTFELMFNDFLFDRFSLAHFRTARSTLTAIKETRHGN